MKFYFRELFPTVSYPTHPPQKIWERLGGMAVPTRKARLVGLLLPLIRQAASALLELSSPTLTSWRGFCRQPDWAPCWLGTRALAPWDLLWVFRVTVPTPPQVALWGPRKEISPSMISMQQCAGLFLVVFDRLAHGRTKPANLLHEGSCKCENFWLLLARHWAMWMQREGHQLIGNQVFRLAEEV